MGLHVSAGRENEKESMVLVLLSCLQCQHFGPFIKIGLSYWNWPKLLELKCGLWLKSPLYLTTGWIPMKTGPNGLVHVSSPSKCMGILFSFFHKGLFGQGVHCFNRTIPNTIIRSTEARIKKKKKNRMYQLYSCCGVTNYPNYSS